MFILLYDRGIQNVCQILLKQKTDDQKMNRYNIPRKTQLKYLDVILNS